MTGLSRRDLIRLGSASSGLLLILFLVVHLAGVIPSLIAPTVFEAYASALHHAIWLPLLETTLAAAVLLHIVTTLLKAIGNRQAGNSAALISRRGQPLAALASRSKVAAGIITLTFLIIHLQQLRWPRPLDGNERAALMAVLHNPVNATVYCAAAITIALHLIHGSEAAHRNLGWLTPTNGTMIRRGGRLLATVLGGGFLLISLALTVAAVS
jgi:succinate dehydrogenase / fumarate reductase cytochrome b subunit